MMTMLDFFYIILNLNDDHSLQIASLKEGIPAKRTQTDRNQEYRGIFKISDKQEKEEDEKWTEKA